MQGISGAASVVGVGMTDLSRDSGRSVLQLALQACREAITDSGLEAPSIDAVLSYHLGDSAPVNDVAQRLGLGPETWTNEYFGGGTQSASILGDAAALIHGGLARSVLVYRALNGRSGKRMGQAGLRLGAEGADDFTVPYGMLGPVHLFALGASRWLHDRGATEADLAAVVVQSRAHARANPRAQLREPFDEGDHAAAPYVATPLRRVDCCLETDGAVALVLTRARDARVSRPGSPMVHAVVRGGGEGVSLMDRSPDVSAIFSSHVARQIFIAAGMTARDIDLAVLYDAYSHVVLQQLEDFGFCRPGEAGEMFRSGACAWNGQRPVNPHGGMLSEGYVHGFNNVAEAVRQLRGGGVNQVHDPATALCTGFGGSYGSAVVLART